MAAALAAGGLVSGALGADDDEHKVDCSKTGMTFEAPGYEVTCEDHSDTEGADSVTVGVKLYVLHAMSEKDITFLDVIDDHILGHTGVFYSRTSLQSDIDRYFKGKFSDWADQDEIGGFDVKRFSAVFGSEKEPIECIAFRREGARRYSGIAGKTVGIACSAQGRDYAVNALKQFNKD